MEEMAQVIRVINTEMAEVELRKHSACGHCGGCSRGQDEEPTRFEVSNPIGAEVGEMVMVEMETGSLVKAVIVIYLLPLVNLILGYIVGNWLNTSYHFTKGEGFAAIVGLVFFVLTFVFVRYYDRRAGLNSSFRPRITRVM